MVLVEETEAQPREEVETKVEGMVNKLGEVISLSNANILMQFVDKTLKKQKSRFDDVKYKMDAMQDEQPN